MDLVTYFRLLSRVQVLGMRMCMVKVLPVPPAFEQVPSRHDHPMKACPCFLKYTKHDACIAVFTTEMNISTNIQTYAICTVTCLLNQFGCDAYCSLNRWYDAVFDSMLHDGLFVSIRHRCTMHDLVVYLINASVNGRMFVYVPLNLLNE